MIVWQPRAIEFLLLPQKNTRPSFIVPKIHYNRFVKAIPDPPYREIFGFGKV